MAVSIIGSWDVSIKTPVGSLQVVYSFAGDVDAVSGSATGPSETVTLTDLVIDDDGRRVRWRQTVTKPMRLKLEFDVHVDGDRFSGHSRAGRLPRSAVTGVRRA
jgi:hypothetical protein